MSNALKVMIVDDTITYRTILRNIVETMPIAKVIATAPNGKVALTKMQEEAADLILLDIEMPEMDGLETLKHIRKQYPETGVVMVSGMNRSSADITIRALEMGALDFIPKPEGDSLKQSAQELKQQLSQVFQQFEAQRVTKNNKRSQANTRSSTISSNLSLHENPATPITRGDLRKLGRVDVIAIGASTGGPSALTEVLSKLPGDLGVPILLVQHMPPVFTASMANSLSKKCALKVKEAEHLELVAPNTVYIAPGGQHMLVRKNSHSQIQIILTNDEPEHSCRPAVDVLFRSIAEVYGKNILSLIMTGMGSDGALGVKALKQVGGYSLTQSEKTCVVYGMPQAVVKMQLSDEAVDLTDLAKRLIQAVHQK